MVTAFSMLAEIVRDMGTGSAIIQSSKAGDNMYNTAFCFNIVVGIVVFLIFFFTAPLIAHFFTQDGLKPLIRTFSIIYIIGSLNIVQEAILQKNLEFKRLFFIDVISVTVSGVAAIFMAMNGYGAWSLVFQYIIMIAMATIVLWSPLRGSQNYSFTGPTFKEINNYSFNLFTHNVVYFWPRN